MCMLTQTLIIRLHLWHFVLAYTLPNHSDVSHVFRPLKQCAWVASRDARELRAELHCLVDRSLSPLCVAAVVGLEIKTCVSSLERTYTATEEPAWMTVTNTEQIPSPTVVAFVGPVIKLLSYRHTHCAETTLNIT